MLTAKEIVTFDDAPAPEGESPWVGDHRMDYNHRKQAIVREIYARAFRGLGLLTAR